MTIRLSISLLLSLVSSYLLFQAHNNFISGMNPFIVGAIIVIAISLFCVSYIVVNKVDNKNIRIPMRIIILIALLTPVLFFFFQQPTISNGNPSRRYVDTVSFR